MKFRSNAQRLLDHQEFESFTRWCSFMSRFRDVPQWNAEAPTNCIARRSISLLGHMYVLRDLSARGSMTTSIKHMHCNAHAAMSAKFRNVRGLTQLVRDLIWADARLNDHRSSKTHSWMP